MGSLFEELARREAVARQRIEEIREQIVELTGLLEVEEDRLSRLVITRETVEEVVGEAAGTVEDLAVEFDRVDPGASSGVAGSPPIGVLTVPPWRPGLMAAALPTAYRDAVEILADAAAPMRAGQIATAMGLEDTAAKREGLRSKLKRLVERGWAMEKEPGLFTLTASATSEPSGEPGGMASSPVG